MKATIFNQRRSMYKQQGSAHVIISVIVVVGLLGALGYVFWQNFHSQEKNTATAAVSKSANTSSNANTVERSVPEGYMAYADQATGYTLAYPKQWGSLKEVATESSSNRLGANGDNTKSFVDVNGIVRIQYYTEPSFFTQNNSGYVVRYQSGEAMGTEAGTETYNSISPINGTNNVYSSLYGDIGQGSGMQFGLFFKTGTTVVYVDAGDTEEVQLQIAKTVDITE